MPEFVLNRNHALRTTHGHMINFIKGQPTWVPPICVRDAIAIGASAVDAKDADEAFEEDAQDAVELSAEDREALLFAAFDQLEARNGTNDEYRADYSAQGLPMLPALEKIVGFKPTAAERNDAFQKYREAKAS